MMTPRFRGHIELIGNEETGAPNCVVCGMCQRACPSVCISRGRREDRKGGKGKVLTTYILDFTKCSLCGSCVESCNFNAIHFSKDYNLASFDKNDYIFDLVKRLEDKTLMQSPSLSAGRRARPFSLPKGFVGLVFLLTVGLVIAGALIATNSRRLVRCVAGLALAFTGVAGVYYFLLSPFVAMMQMLIYVGAVCILIAFAHHDGRPRRTRPAAAGPVVLASPIGVQRRGLDLCRPRRTWA